MKKNKYAQYVELLLLAVAVFGFMRLFSNSSLAKELKPETSEEQLILWVGLVAMIFVVLAVHELGHLLTGLFQGFRFQLFVVGPLGIKRDENEQVRVYFNTNLSYFGGVAATTPVEDHPANARKLAWVLLAGPLISLLFAALCYGLALWAGKPLGIVWYIGSAVSIAIFFATTLPSRTGMFFTDRKRFQRLITPGKDQDVEMAMLRIMGRFAKDQSYENVDQKDINELVEDQYPMIRFFGLFNLMCWQLERTGEVATSTQEQYDATSADVSKSLVKAFNQEIEKYRTRVTNSERG